MLKPFLIVACFVAVAYWRRYGFRQAWYVLKTGNLDPDFESIDAEHYLGRKKGEKKKETLAEKLVAMWRVRRSRQKLGS